MRIGVGVTCSNIEDGWLGFSHIEQHDYVIIRGDNTVAGDKNRLIKHLYDEGADFVFIFDDDCFPIKPGWEQFFINASNKTGIQHFVLCNDKHNIRVGYADNTRLYETGTGCMLFLTRQCIDKVGYMNPAYGKYGFEHAAYSWRIYRAGLTPYWYTSLNGWEEYIYSWDLQKEDGEKHGFVKVQTITDADKQKYIKENELVFDKEMSSPQLFYNYI